MVFSDSMDWNISTSCVHEDCKEPIVTDPDQFSGYYHISNLCAEHLRIANQCYLDGCCNPSIRIGWMYTEKEYYDYMYLCEEHLVQKFCRVLSSGKYRCYSWNNCYKEVSVGCVLYCQDCFFKESCVVCGQSLKTGHPPSYSTEEKGCPQTCDKSFCKKRHDRDQTSRKYEKVQKGPVPKRQRLEVDIKTLDNDMSILGILD